MWPNPLETADFATFIEELLNGKLIKNLLSHHLFLHLNIYFDWIEHLRKKWRKKGHKDVADQFAQQEWNKIESKIQYMKTCPK